MNTEKIDAVLIEDGIIENIVKKGAQIEKEDLDRIKEINQSITGGKKYCVLVTSHEVSSITREAREYVASKEYVRDTIAKAIMINSLGQRVIGNFYIKVNKPKIKTKLFTDREAALKWLKHQLKIN